MHTPQPPASYQPSDRGYDDRGADVLGPLLSAAIFGYFGFFTGLRSDDDSGAVVPLYLATVWVLRISAILFLASAVIGMVGKPRTGLLAGIAGAVATIGLTVVTAWSIIDPERDIAVNHLIMILCILWNAYSAFTAIRSALR
ncbi:MAG: hypothetical protein NTU45_07210 [Planctomycetota bacterium]|jgi:hypothetical protein|nr:hypothetical protein [Planctomycetota bacterium]